MISPLIETEILMLAACFYQVKDGKPEKVERLHWEIHYF